jgi:hypothetical protein
MGIIYPFNLIIHPRRTAQEILKGKGKIVTLLIIFLLTSFLKIDPYYYVLLQAIVFPLLFFVTWVMMAASARLISIFFRGKVTFKQYLVLLGHSFFPFFILAMLFPSINWTALIGLGAIYNGIVAQETEGYPFWKAIFVSIATVIWPILLVINAIM